MTLYVSGRKSQTQQPTAIGINRSNGLAIELAVAATPLVGPGANLKVVDHCGTQIFYDPYATGGGPSFRYAYDSRYIGAKHQASATYKYTGNSKFPIRASSAYSLTLICKFSTSPSNSANICQLEGAGTWRALLINTTATGTLQLTTTNGTAIDSGITPSIDTLYTLTGVIGGGQMEFFINGVSVGTSNSSVGQAGYAREIYVGGGAISAEVIYAVIAHTTKLNLDAVFALYENPWQIFAPRRQWFALSQVTNVQLLYPSSDISTGSWTPSTGTTLYAVLDEAVADNSDYIEAVTPTSCEIMLEAGAAPLIKTNHTLKYTLLSGSGSITVKLVQGTSVIKTWNHSLTGSDQLIASELSEAEAQSITNYADLRVRFET